MSQLRKFILKRGKWSNSFDFRVFELWYLKAGMPRSSGFRDAKVAADAAYVNQNKLYWRVNRWNPFGEAQEAWKDVVGPDAKIVHREEDKWDVNPSLQHRQVYEGTF
jgi:hypothetical protein